MEYAIAAVLILLAVSAIAALVVLVVKLTTSVVGPAEHQRGFDSARALMQPQIDRLQSERDRLWVQSLQLSKREPLALPANTISVPEGYTASVRKVVPKGEQHG